jgi:signal transduction histidine kinase
MWKNPQYAQNLLETAGAGLASRLMLISPDGHLLASSDPGDADRQNQLLELSGLAEAQAGRTASLTRYSQHLQGNVVDVLMPVSGADQQVVGIVRLTYRYASIYEDFLRLRYLIAGVLFVGLLLGTGLGTTLAISIGTPIRSVTEAIDRLARSGQADQLPERGPEEIRLLLRAINFLVERLHDLERYRRQLLANLVHELGRPLGALQSATQALKSGANRDPSLFNELLLGLEGEITRLRHLVDDLVQLREQVLGTLELNRQPVSLREWLSQVLMPWQEAALDKQLHWETDIPPDLPVAHLDSDRFAQVIGNLVSNAIKYTPPGGVVSVSAGFQGEEIWIRVSDTGQGIPPEEQEKIFIPFYRSYQGQQSARGMGLGLSITRELVTAHSGRLELESEPGLGSQFTVWIPAMIPI